MVQKGLKLLEDTYFFGTGSGSFDSEMFYSHFSIGAAHNLFLEVLISYGLVVFIFFIGLFLRMFKFARENPFLNSRFIVFTSLTAFPVVSIINSTYVLSMSVWVLIASLYIIANKRYSF